MTTRITNTLMLYIVLFVTGCASTPVTHQHYLIESPTSVDVFNSDQKIILYPIDLSDYLRSSSLHVKEVSGEILYSATDSWAEQADKMLWRAIAQSLEQQTRHNVLASYEALHGCAQIKIRINELSPSSTGKVVSNGRWFISTGGKVLLTNNFSFTGNIRQDGFSASNKVFAEHLHQLSVEIKENVSRLGLCKLN